MLRSNKAKIADFRADHATHDDFCDVLTKDTKHLYLLAFLLTANHQESEQCFVWTIEEVFKQPLVFKEWVRSWVKRRLIENAITIVWPASARSQRKRDLWSAGQHEPRGESEIDTVTGLADFERFVFVMSILERYSTWDCSLLLGCGTNKIAQARMRALRRFPDLAALLPPGDQPGRTPAAYKSIQASDESCHGCFLRCNGLESCNESRAKAIEGHRLQLNQRVAL